METEQKILSIRIIAGLILLATGFFAELQHSVGISCYVTAYVVAGGDIFYKALKNIFRGKIFDENFLMTIATVGAFGIGEYPEAVAVMLFYQIGEMFSDIAVERSKASISSLMDIRPDYANIEQNGNLVKVSPADIAVGSVIVVKPGERIPLDGIIIKGSATLDTSALTGESMPREVKEDDTVISGSVNMTGLLKIKTTGTYGESTVAKILELVENAESGKARSEKFITKFAKYYTPVVVVIAVLLVVLPLLITGEILLEWIYRALIFLVISCPCALVVSIPLTFFAGIGGASRNGILVKGSEYIELMAKIKTVVFDKTGTLTKGHFSVTAVHPEIIPPEELLELAALAEIYSDHPVSASLRAACDKPLDKSLVTNSMNMAGEGVSAEVDGHKVYAGNEKLMDRIGVKWHKCHKIGTIVHIAVDGKYMGHIVVSDMIKSQSRDAIGLLKKLGIKKTVMLTGDHKNVADDVSRTLGIDEYHAELLPADKVSLVEKLSKSPELTPVAFVGDGINDAPVLKLADVGIAMGAAGSDAAIEAADVVLMNDDPSSVADGIAISRKTMAIVKQNICFAIGIKIAVMLLGALGFANMWAAVFADVGVTLLAVLNALRAMKK